MIEVNRTDGASVEVTFRIPKECGADEACIVGEFNDWSTTAHPLERDDQGFVITVALDAGRTYRFRYLLDGERWANDWAAHDYVPNEYGGDDSLVDLTGVIQRTRNRSPEQPAKRQRRNRARPSEDSIVTS